ncbi:MAG: DMT family transporter [Acidimicrobiaceae bacterium]|mgnify:FL=1|jgi:drug/metabolite transporter (DMT)-like permease|nr:DMT family transporter [Acidimicrobiaceae bacterium]MBT5579346.1 DMT family transporter [Acidimicrobiaceae bacterium]MBT5849052.1 DMT family transporter [Acidimicrobiaceae bacterium]
MSSTGIGSRDGSFAATDWAIIGALALIWGSAFMWIAIGLDALAPGVVAWLRVVLGAVALLLIPRSRRRIDRADWKGVAIIAIAGNAAPALLFSVAEQELDSAVAGMITSATPVATLVLAFWLGNRAVTRGQVVGLVAGFVGVVAMAAPDVLGANAPVVEVGLVLLAVLGYATVNNVVVPLQQRYGGLVVVAQAQALAALVLTPFGLTGLRSSEFDLGPVLAVVFLGIVGTGFSRVLSATLVGRVGPQRGSVVAYFVPVVAIVLGVMVRGESIEAVQIIGLVFVLVGAALISRR